MKRLILLTTVLMLPRVMIAADNAEPQRVVIVQERDAEWGSYRHAYKAAAFFERYTRTRPLIQAHMQIRALDDKTSLAGLSLHLIGEKTNMTIAVDEMGRAELPLLKQAYEDDAVLRLNRQKGLYYFSGRYSVREHEDGVYDAAELRNACEQLLSAQRESGSRLRLLGKKCLGIKFVYTDSQDAGTVQFQTAAQNNTIPATDAHPFENNSMGLYKVAIYRFADWPLQGKIITGKKPLAIGTLYD